MGDKTAISIATAALRAVIANHEYAFDRKCAYYETGCRCAECLARRALAELKAVSVERGKDVTVLEGVVTEYTNNGVRLGLVLREVTGDPAIPVGQRLRLTIERL